MRTFYYANRVSEQMHGTSHDCHSVRITEHGKGEGVRYWLAVSTMSTSLVEGGFRRFKMGDSGTDILASIMLIFN